MAEDGNERLKEAILSVVKKQIADNDPPETALTFKRLLDSGHSREDSLRLIGYIVGREFFDVVSRGLKYDEDRYIKMLQGLPKLPWE